MSTSKVCLAASQAMVDTSACVSDEFLETLNVEKGARRCSQWQRLLACSGVASPPLLMF